MKLDVHPCSLCVIPSDRGERSRLVFELDIYRVRGRTPFNTGCPVCAGLMWTVYGKSPPCSVCQGEFSPYIPLCDSIKIDSKNIGSWKCGVHAIVTGGPLPDAPNNAESLPIEDWRAPYRILRRPRYSVAKVSSDALNVLQDMLAERGLTPLTAGQNSDVRSFMAGVGF
jgi:hypothetical protein